MGVSAGNISPRVDWDRIEVWAHQLAQGDLREISVMFEANTGVPPRVQWNPLPSQMQTAPLRLLLDYWSNLKGQSNWPKGDRVDLQHLAPICGYVALVDVVEDGRDFRWRQCSATMIALLGNDMTGKLFSELPEHSYISESRISLLRAAFRRGELLYTERVVADALYAWHILRLPLADRTDKIGAFLVGTVPVGAAGLPITLDF